MTLIASFPLFIHILLAIFCWLQHNQSVVFFCVLNTVASVLVIVLAQQRRVLTSKTVLMCVNTIAVFIYISQFDLGYNIFCYIFPLIFGLFLLFDFKTELPSFYLVVSVVLFCAIGSFLLPSHFFGRLNLPEWQKHFFGIFNIILAAIIVVVFLSILVRMTVQKEKQLQKALVEVEAAANDKTAFLRNMSHELRTPLNGITGTVNILLNEDCLPVQQGSLNNLRHLSEHMTALVNDILDYSKIEAGSLELYSHRFNLRVLLDKIANIFASTFSDKGVAFRLDIDERLKEIDLYSDEMRLQQILYNLLSNAAKFTEQGSVILRASIVRLTSAHIDLYISVADTGIGIHPEKKTDIFKSFQQGDAATTRKYGGTGLGLTISNSLVKLFGGVLDVTSTLGKGSTFYMHLPMQRYQQAVHEEDKSIIDPVKELANMRILLAEDNPINMLVATKALESAKMDITTAENGKMAVAKFRRGRYDVVLLDLEMPEMDGRVALTEIRKIDPAVPVLAFTAAFYEDMRQELLAAGFTDYILKPFKPEVLYKKIVMAIGHRGDL
jgi:signal transduction histidine kinase